MRSLCSTTGTCACLVLLVFASCLASESPGGTTSSDGTTDDSHSTPAPTTESGDDSSSGDGDGDGDGDGGFVPDKQDMPADPGTPEVDSHADDIQPIWTQNCINYCHAAGGDEPPSGNLDLYDGAYENLVGALSLQAPMVLVEPGECEQSYLWHKLTGNHLNVGGEGEAMPSDLAPLSDDDLSKVRVWIEIGAPP